MADYAGRFGKGLPMNAIRAAIVWLALVCAGPALAIDPGTASGRYEGEEGKLTFSHAVALSLDVIEETPAKKQVRVLLSDTEVPPAALTGRAFPPVWKMARDGKVKGLLLEFDPADPKSMNVTVLAPPEPGYSLANISLSNSEGLWARLQVGATRATGDLKPDASDKMSFSFSAPVFSDAVTADLKGAAALTSEPVKVLTARAEAMAKGDMAAVVQLSTEASAADLSALPPDVLKQARTQMIPTLLKGLRAPTRAVIREQTASVQIGKGMWTNARKVDGVWKAD